MLHHLHGFIATIQLNGSVTVWINGAQNHPALTPQSNVLPINNHTQYVFLHKWNSILFIAYPPEHITFIHKEWQYRSKDLIFSSQKSFFYHQSSIWLRTIVWSNFKPLVSMLRVCPRPASIFYREIVLFHFPHVEMKYCLLSTRHVVCN